MIFLLLPPLTTHADPGHWYLGGGPAFSFLDPDTSGNPTLSVTDDTDVGVFSWPHNGRGLSGFLKGGGVGLSTDAGNIQNYEENAGQIFAGGGARYNFGKGWGARLEYEYFFADVQMITLSVVKRFGFGAQPQPAPEPEPVAQTQPEPATETQPESEVAQAPKPEPQVASFTGELPVILFPFDSDRLSATARAQADTMVEALRNYPTLRLEVQGHTCNIGSEAYNDGLSARRAQSVVNYLISNGVDSIRLQRSSYSERNPAASNASAAGRRQNRRVEFRILDP